MAYNDLFGESPRQFEQPYPTAEDDTQRDVTPLNRVEESLPDLTPVIFDRFCSGHPFLLERPSKYLARMRDAGEVMLALDEGEDVTDRLLYSPLVSLPVISRRPEDKFTREEATWYPLLHAPDNKPFDPNAGIPFDEYMLTMIITYIALNIIAEDDHDLLAYPVKDSVEVPEDTWNAAAEWVHDNQQYLRDLNIARLVGFAMQDPDNESQPLQLLMDAWNVPVDVNGVMSKAQVAAEHLRPDFAALFPDLPYDPFTESPKWVYPDDPDDLAAKEEIGV